MHFAQTVRYTKYLRGVYAPGKIVFVRADDLNWFTTDVPDVPPGESDVEPSVGRWSRVIISHTSSVQDLIDDERRFYPEVPVKVIIGHVFK